MQPGVLLRLSTRGADETIVLSYLTERDHPWLRAALEEYARFVGRRRSELRERLQEPLPVPAPKAKLRFVANLLETLGSAHTAAPVPPREARALVFRAAASRPFERKSVVARTAEALGVSASELELSLFADLKTEQRVTALPNDLNPAGLAVDANLALVRAWLRRAVRVRITAWGKTRALVRQARLSGLICLAQRAPRRGESGTRPEELDAVEFDEPSEGVVLDISGPFALFRHTEVYGRALAALVPRAAWCNHFEITANCTLGRGKQTAKLMIRSGDPIGAGRELARHDSRLEERFERDFRRAAPEWDIVREPRPVDAAGALVFPDFELYHRRDTERRWLLEIAGFWTPEYLTAKLARLRAARLDRLILCIDERRRCTDAELPPEARIVRYEKRIDPASILAIIGSRGTPPLWSR